MVSKIGNENQGSRKNISCLQVQGVEIILFLLDNSVGGWNFKILALMASSRS